MKHLDWENFDAVAFDVEGTLADTIPTHHAARMQAFEHHGYGYISKSQHDLGPTYGSSSADIIGGVLYAAGEIQKDAPFAQHPAVKEVIATKMAFFEQMSAQGFQEMPEATNFVHKVAAKFAGHMALVTSSPQRFVLPFIDRHNLRSYFPEGYIISEDTVLGLNLRGKPAPDPYLLAMQRLHVAPQRLLVFEDTVPGAAAAKAAGATVIALAFEPQNTQLFTTGNIPYPPDLLVHDYPEAAEALGL